MKQIGLIILAVLASLAMPAGAGAHQQRHHHARHALRHHRAYKADAGCPEVGGDNPTWAEWRAEMAEIGFSPEETEELEACG